MNLAIFRIFFVLFSLGVVFAFGQVPDNVAFVELSSTTFSIERPFTISVIIPNSEDRATVTFPDIAGFIKKGTSTSVTPSEINGKSIISQVITQTYQARTPGQFRLPPFSIEVNKETVHSEGALLIVEPSTKASAPVNTTLNTLDITTKGAAFLDIRASKASVFTGEELTLTLSFFVADNYPYTLDFKGLDKQLQAITKKIRPTNAWEENLPITELKPIPVSIRGKKFREIRLYQSTFFPLSNQDIKLPSVSIQLTRTRPVIGPPTAQLEKALFTSKPLTIRVDALPKHPLQGRVPVGTFHIEEGLERQSVTIGQSIRYTFTLSGEGNIATLPAPTLLNEANEIDVFPPEERHTTTRIGNQITGRKTFTYFIVPRQNGQISLANHFQWIYFDPRTAKYDTLRSRLRLQVGDKSPEEGESISTGTSNSSLPGETVQSTTTDNSIYAGIAAMDSTRQPISISVLIRAIANVLILIMLLGMIFVFFKKQNTSR